MSEARRADSREAPKSAGRDVGSIDYRQDGMGSEEKMLREREDTGRRWIDVRLVEPSARRCLKKVCCSIRA